MTSRSTSVRGAVRRLATGGMVLGFASGLLAGPLTSPAAAGGPAATGSCTVTKDGNQLGATITGFPQQTLFQFFALVRYGDGRYDVEDGFELFTDALGEAFTPIELPQPAARYPANIVGFVVYHDANQNLRWDPDTDPTVLRAQGIVADCPRSVPLAPK